LSPSFETIQPIAARAWPPERLAQIGGWRLHASRGFSGRSNCCWPLAAPDRPLDAAIEAVEAWYAGRGLASLFIMPDAPDLDDLGRILVGRGYSALKPTLVMTGPLAEGDAGPAVISDAVDEAFCDLFVEVQGDGADAAERVGTLRRIAPPRAFASARIDGRAVAIGACAIEGEWAGVFGMRTAAEHRRRGLAQAVIAALSAAARDAGASRAYLQVEADNAPAIALYERLGFATAYTYRYLKRP
jgi:GNAT superfamily N-acetyltransferase